MLGGGLTTPIKSAPFIYSLLYCEINRGSLKPGNSPLSQDCSFSIVSYQRAIIEDIHTERLQRLPSI